MQQTVADIGFNWADYAILVIIALSVIISVIRGFAKEALSLAGWIISFWVAVQFSPELQPLLADYIDTPSLQLLISFVVLLIMGLFVTGFINFLVGQVIQKTGLSGTDRMVGVLFGGVRGVVIVAALVLMASMTPIPSDPWWQASQLLPHFEQLAAELQSYLPEDIPARFGDSELFQQVVPAEGGP
ncbi:CvpA family protein [Ectothiorhodospiraceae bacterium BW-2]|nr:CvpA family protein [Ectothiorhodospiraceae bacterium BW-2]